VESTEKKSLIGAVASTLFDEYRDFKHFNRTNPLDELIFIICSVKTKEREYRKVYSSLKFAFPSFHNLVSAPEDEIVRALAGGGLQNAKTFRIRAIISLLIEKYGRPTLDPLKKMTDQDCEEFLTSLPGVGKKVARCVMMYSLGRQVFPVDTHCWRICRRLGWVRPTAKDGHPTGRDMDRLQAKIPPELRFSLHVNMVSLGREFCTARDPDCGGCPVADLCPKVGVKKPTMRRTVEYKD